MTYIIVFILITLLTWVGLAQIFKKANVEPWKAFVPILNWSEWLKLIGKPQWWIILLFIPLVNIFYYAYMLLGLSKAFKHYGFWHHAAAVLFPFIYLPYLGFSKEEKYFGVDGLRPGEHMPETGAVRSWVDSLIFAIIAAHLIRMFLIEAYKIPTSSMEPTLQIGDYMFVSKAHYGSRIPITPLALPLMHHTIPFTQSRAYSELIQLDYHRLPALQKIKRNDIVVFNVPFEYNMKSPLSLSYYPELKYDSRPIDKREHYIKRAVGIAGDTLEIVKDQLYINGQEAENPENLQFHYVVKTKEKFSFDQWREMGLRSYVNYFNGSSNPRNYRRGNGFIELDATRETMRKFSDNPAFEQIVAQNYTSGTDAYYAQFPSNANEKGWSVRDFGPIIIPAEGLTIQLTPENIDTYREAIVIHEDNELVVRDNFIFINGEEVKEYTFKYDYYWMMGDNRHSSLDSRAWGFVPETHIVGKPLFIFFSKQGGQHNPGTRWNRIFKGAQDMN